LLNRYLQPEIALPRVNPERRGSVHQSAGRPDQIVMSFRLFFAFLLALIHVKTARSLGKIGLSQIARPCDAVASSDAENPACPCQRVLSLSPTLAGRDLML
jgi:hypothetical protein